jgi:[protein-PII] uridylyltransferase
MQNINDIDGYLNLACTSSGLKAQPIIEGIEQANLHIYAEFDRGVAIESLVARKAEVIDKVLKVAIEHFIPAQPKNSCCLVAVGGYGRKELLPGSDIDLMLLLEKKPSRQLEEQISLFLTFLWDIGLEVGHSVRTVKDCVREGKADVTVITNMIESRLLHGNEALYANFKKAIAPRKMWSSRKFFEAKLEEQHNRHLRFNDTAYNLEPNIKEGPGGLRDIQIIVWVTKRHFGTGSFRELVDHDFITEVEYEILQKGQQHLWKVRFALHRLAKRGEDRLLFDYQNQLAAEFGFKAGKNNLAIEKFMQQYYRTIMDLERLNEMLLQIFHEEIILTERQKKTSIINDRFLLRNRYLAVRDDNVFKQHPPALVELFLLISTNAKCDGVAASTIRLVREHLYLVDEQFRRNDEVTSLFMQLMSAPSGMTHQMRRMNSYGFLAAYIPAFGKITGRMQYDLFHAYTVDEHTIFVIRNLRRFALDKHKDEFPFCNEVYRELENPTLLFIAALFHDIAKGREGDHSVLGEEDAIQFCLQHKLNRKDTRVVSQLVRNHLVMSVTAQRKDISDPDVVRDFARKVGSIGMLNYLYLLTVADIRSTNPKLWNNWKDALLQQLYAATKNVLHIGVDTITDIDEIIRENREDAFEEMRDLPYSSKDIHQICNQLPDDYFLRHRPLEIRWHVKTILDNPNAETLVKIRQARHTKTTKVFVYCDEHPYVFSQVTGVLGSLGLTILNAEIFTTDENKVMDTFIIQDHNNKPVNDKAIIRQIETELIKTLNTGNIYQSTSQKRQPRQLKAFNHPTEIVFEQDYVNKRTVMHISAIDMPGLLSVIANVIATMDINITHAKIATLGEKIDDIFYLTTPEGENIVDPTILDELEKRMTEALSSKKAA